MTRQERLDIGEKIFIGAFVGSIVIEVLLTVFAVTFNPAWDTLLPWTILVLGAVFVAFLLYLANWLYTGNRTAWTTALAFAAFQIVLASGVIVGMLTNHNFAAYLGASLIWLAIIKAVAYAAFAGFLALPKSVHDFLGLRRGETIVEDTPPAATLTAAEVVTPSPTVPLTDDQAAAFGSLSKWMQTAAGLLIVAGVLRVSVGVINFHLVSDWMLWLPLLLQGIAAIVLGVVLFAPATALKLVQGRVTDRLMDAFKRLQALYFLQLILLGVVIAAVVIGIATAFLLPIS